MKRSASALALLACCVFAAPAAAAPAAGGTDPFSLGVTALLGQDGATDVFLKATSDSSGVAPPSAFKQVQLKSFDTTGELVYARNASDVPAPGGSAVLRRSDLERGQPVKLRALAQTGQTKNTVVLNAEATVKRRPDLAFGEIDAPTQVAPGVPFTVSAQVKELNGDTAGSGKVAILNGETELDRMNALSVGAGAMEGGMFALELSEPGTYTLTALISGVTPGEWDTTNNTATFTVQVVSPNKTMSWNGDYHKSEFAHSWEMFSGGSSTTTYSHSSRWKFENLSAYYWTPEQITSTGTLDLTVTPDDGAPQNVKVTDVLQGEGCSYHWLAEWHGNVQVCASLRGTYVHFWRFAGDYRVSHKYSGYYGGYSHRYGEFIGAQESVSVKLDMPDTAGTHHGGGFTLALNSFGNDYEYDSRDYDSYDWDGYRYRYSHQWSSVYGWGSGQTAW